MKIEYTQFIPDPALRGKTTHLPAHIAQVLIATGQAKEVKLPPRSAPGWAEARVALSRETQGPPVAGDTVVEFHKDPQWSVVAAPISGRPTFFRKWGYETARFVGVNAAEQAKANYCPEAILKQYDHALNAKDTHGQQIAEAKIEQQNREIEEKTTRWAYLGAG
jgi:hypothetical protein